MNAPILGNAVLLASFGIFLVTAPAAPAFAVSSLLIGVAIKAGMDHFAKEMRHADERRKDGRRRKKRH